MDQIDSLLTVAGISIENERISIRLSDDSTQEFSAPQITQFQVKRLNQLVGFTYYPALVQRMLENNVIDLSGGLTLLDLTADEDIEPRN